MRFLVAAALLVLLVPVPPVDAVVAPAAGTWKTLLDPLGLTPVEFDVAQAPDGDVGLFFEESSLPKFARSAPGADTFTVVTVDAAAGTPNDMHVEVGNAVNEWFVFFRSGANLLVYRSTDDGATWTNKVSVADDTSDIAVVNINQAGRWGIASASGTELLWYRTSDNFETLDRNAVVLQSDPDPDFLSVTAISRSSSRVELWFQNEFTGLTNEAIYRIHSDDGGGFWSSTTQVDMNTVQFKNKLEMVNTPAGAVFVSIDDSNGNLRWWWIASFGTSGTAGPTYTPGSCVDTPERGMAYVNGVVYLYACDNLLYLSALSASGVWTPVVGDSVPGSDNGRVALAGTSDLIVGINNNGFGQRFQLHYLRAGLPPAVSNSVAVTNLVGFDVSDTGSVVVARTDGGAFVRTFDGTTLSNMGNVDTKCNQLNGVSAVHTHVSFFNCEAGGDVEFLSIRSIALGAPDTPDVCTNTGFCVQDLNAHEFAGGELDDEITLTHVYEYPFDYSKFKDGFVDDDWVFSAWGVGTSAGRAGILTYAFNNNADDTSDIDTVSITNQLVDQVSTCQGTDGRTWLYAATNLGRAKGITFVFDEDRTTFSRPILRVQGLLAWTAPASLDGAKGVGCGTDKFAVLNANKVTIWTHGGTSPLLTITDPGFTAHEGGGLSGSVDMSLDDKWVTWVASGKVWVANALTGEIVFSDTLPTGTFQGVRIDGAGNYAWVATSTTIRIYPELYQSTTGEETIVQPPGFQLPGTGGGGGSGPGVFNGASSQVGDALGVGSMAGGLLLSLIVIGAMAASAGFAMRGVAPVLGMIGGAIGGLMFSWIFGFIDGAIIFVIVLLGAGFLAFRLFNRGSAEGM